MAQWNSYSNMLDSEVATGDELGIWDISVGQFKNITVTEFQQYLEGAMTLAWGSVSGKPTTVSQAEAEAGTATTDRLWTAQRVAQAIAALAGGGGLTVTSVKTANYTAAAGELVPMNNTAAARTLTLPLSPSAGDQVGWIDYGKNFDGNNLTVARNGSNIMGLAEDMTVSVRNGNALLTYIDATLGWAV